MKIIRGLHNLNRTLCDRVITIGNFDGMHLGHQQLLSLVNDIAKREKIPALVMIFEPQPEEYFSENVVPVRLMRLRQKLDFLKRYPDINEVLIVPFNQSFAEKTEAQFVEEILIDKLQAKTLVVGEDFCFGKSHQGNVTYLEHMQNLGNFTVKVLPDIYCTLDGEQRRISSSWIRELLKKGDLKNATKLLGHSCVLCG